MRKKKLLTSCLVFFLALIVTVFFFCSCTGKTDKASIDKAIMADAVLVNGKIITVDPSDSIAEAVAIKNGKIVAVGSNKLVKKMIGKGTQVIDLKGLTATPGLIDSHCHFANGGITMFNVLDLDYPKVKKVADMVELVKAKVETLKSGEWIIAKGWDEGKLEERRYVYASDIDAVTPNNPGWFMPTMGHYGTANSYALKLASITKDTPDPPGGTIDRYSDGTPTGLLKESAQRLVTRLIPPRTPEQIQKGIIKIIEEYNKAGMTAVKDPAINSDLWELYQKMLAEDKLTVRVFTLWATGKTVKAAQDLIDRVGAFTKPYISTGDDRLVSGGIKIFVDGSGGGRTAWVYKEWNKNYKEVDKGNYGYPAFDQDIFRKQVKMFHDAGLHMGVHAIGDRGIDWLVDSYAIALKENPIHGLRHSIIHCNIPTDHAIEVMEKMQKTHGAGYPEFQSTFMWWIGDTYAGNFGPERCPRFMPFKTCQNKGMIWGGGSDFPVTPFEGKYGIWATITRKPMMGTYGAHPYGTDQCVDVHAALQSYTIWNAHQLFMEDKIGSIEIGKYADIAVWDKDLYTIPTDEIKDLKCQMTLLGGEIVYKDKEAPIEISRSN